MGLQLSLRHTDYTFFDLFTEVRLLDYIAQPVSIWRQGIIVKQVLMMPLIVYFKVCWQLCCWRLKQGWWRQSLPSDTTHSEPENSALQQGNIKHFSLPVIKTLWQAACYGQEDVLACCLRVYTIYHNAEGIVSGTWSWSGKQVKTVYISSTPKKQRESWNWSKAVKTETYSPVTYFLQQCYTS